MAFLVSMSLFFSYSAFSAFQLHKIFSWEQNQHRGRLGFSLPSISHNYMPIQVQKSLMLGIRFSDHKTFRHLYIWKATLIPLDGMYTSEIHAYISLEIYIGPYHWGLHIGIHIKLMWFMSGNSNFHSKTQCIDQV